MKTKGFVVVVVWLVLFLLIESFFSQIRARKRKWNIKVIVAFVTFWNFMLNNPLPQVRPLHPQPAVSEWRFPQRPAFCMCLKD